MTADTLKTMSNRDDLHVGADYCIQVKVLGQQ